MLDNIEERLVQRLGWIKFLDYLYDYLGKNNPISQEDIDVFQKRGKGPYSIINRLDLHELKSRYIVVDLDGTLADCTHRLHYLEDKNWDGFYSKMHLDLFNSKLWEVIQLLNPSRIFVLTGRPDSYREVTEKWLAANNAHVHRLYMRDDNDFRKSQEYKAEVLENIQNFYLEMNQNNTYIFEDDDRCIEMFKKKGFLVLKP